MASLASALALSAPSPPLAATTTVVSSSNQEPYVGQTVKFTVTVASTSPIPNGDQVSIEEVTSGPAVVLAVVPLSGGIATFSTNSLHHGLHEILAVYLGDSQFASSVSSELGEMVLRYPTATTIVSNTNSPVVGQPATFTATVTSASGIMPGNGEIITFSNNGNPVGTAALVNGQASFTTTFTAAQDMSIEAYYPGDSNNRISLSLPVVVLVNPGTTTTTLTSSLNPSAANQAVTLVATVAAQSGGIPTGSVSFLGDNSLLGTVPLNGFQAAFLRVFRGAGVKSLTAVYSGDANYRGSSGTIPQTITSGPISAAPPCAAPCFVSGETTYAGNARYFGAYFPEGLPSSFTSIVAFPGAGTTTYDNPAALGSFSVLFMLYSDFVSFANANNVAIMWVMPTAYDASSNGGAPPFAQCLSSACNASAIWAWQLPWYFTNTGSNPSNFLSYDASDAGYVHSMIGILTGSWGASTVLGIGGSTGGIFLNNYAQQYPSDFLAIGLFAGPLWSQITGETNSPGFNFGSNVNVFYTHGDADPILPYCGGVTSDPWTGLPGGTNTLSTASVDTTFDYWAGPSGMNCSTITPSANLCTSGTPTTGVISKRATGCSGGKWVQFLDIPGGRHKDAATATTISEFWNATFPGNPAH